MKGKGTRARRVAAAFAAAVLLLIPFGVLVFQFLSVDRAAADAVATERAGITYLRPLMSLVSALSVAQSAAVRGQSPQPDGMKKAAADVDAADAGLGQALATTSRWTELRGRIDRLATRSSTGQAAYTDFSSATTLAIALFDRIGDTSRLTVDGVVDTHHLAETAVRLLPELLVDSGRYHDLLALGAAPRADVARYTGQAALTRDQVRRVAAGADDELQRGFQVRPGGIGPEMTGRLDTFRTAVTDVVPTVALTDTAPPLPAADELASRRERLDRATTELHTAVLAQLDSSLIGRKQDLAGRRLLVSIASVLGLVAIGLALWLMLPAPQRVRADIVPEPETGDEDQGPARAVPGEDALIMLDARELLGRGELMRIGRAVRRPREPDDETE